MTIISNKARRNLNSTTRQLAKAAAVADKVGSRTIRWAVTDSIGIGQRMLKMPPMGLGDTIGYILLQLIVTVLGALATGVLAFLLIAYGIPYFLFGHL